MLFPKKNREEQEVEKEEKNTLANFIFKNTYAKLNDFQIMALGILFVVLLSIIFFFIDIDVFKSIITNLIIFSSFFTFGLKAYANFVNKFPLRKVIPYALVPVIVTILTGVLLK